MNSASVELLETVDWILDLYASGPPTSRNASPLTDRRVCRQRQRNGLRESGERRITKRETKCRREVLGEGINASR
jgi:hypothetical protein